MQKIQAERRKLSAIYVIAVREYLSKLAIRCRKITLHVCVKRIAAECGMSERQVLYCLAELARRGEIERERRRQVDGVWQTTLTTLCGSLYREVYARMAAFGKAVRHKVAKLAEKAGIVGKSPHARRADNVFSVRKNLEFRAREDQKSANIALDLSGLAGTATMKLSERWALTNPKLRTGCDNGSERT